MGEEKSKKSTSNAEVGKADRIGPSNEARFESATCCRAPMPSTASPFTCVSRVSFFFFLLTSLAATLTDAGAFAFLCF